jgi:hypothetical protein
MFLNLVRSVRRLPNEGAKQRGMGRPSPLVPLTPNYHLTFIGL